MKIISFIFPISENSISITDLNYAVYSNLGFFLHTIRHNLSLKVAPTNLRGLQMKPAEDLRLK
jgi:hypothetical protein